MRTFLWLFCVWKNNPLGQFLRNWRIFSDFVMRYFSRIESGFALRYCTWRKNCRICVFFLIVRKYWTYIFFNKTFFHMVFFYVFFLPYKFYDAYVTFSKHWPSGPMLSISRNVRLSVVRPSVRTSVHFWVTV